MTNNRKRFKIRMTVNKSLEPVIRVNDTMVGYFQRRWERESPLLGERVWVREYKTPTFSSPAKHHHISCSRLKNDRQAHRQPKRLLRPASTCSQEIPLRGFFSNSARRRSSSADCSGVSSSSKPPYFSITCSATSCCSSGGNRSICLRISAALMALIYPVDLFTQAGLCTRNTPPNSFKSLKFDRLGTSRRFRPARKSYIVNRKSARHDRY
jgi:hypothetical protein